MANPYFVLSSMKVFKEYFTPCPKCGYVVVHKRLPEGAKLTCKRCKNVFRVPQSK